jgi:hypothetical protein
MSCRTLASIRGIQGARLLAILAIVTGVGILLLVLTADKFFFATGRGSVVAGPESDQPRNPTVIDLRPRFDWQVLPHYVDLEVGDSLRVIREDGEEVELRVLAIQAESRPYTSPKVAVTLESGGRRYSAYCGMVERERGGVGPIEIDGVKLAVEVTRMVFSKMKRGSSDWNAYRHFRLRGDLRLAVWDAASPIMRGETGLFVVDQPEWTRDRYGNWLHSTSYGLHSAIDIYSTQSGVGEPVRSPVDGTVYKVYHVNAAPDDPRRNKVVNIHGKAIVGPGGERIFYRFHHLSEIHVSKGESVRRGQVIGLTGHTGFDAEIGDHLHFEMRLNPSCFGFEKDDDIFATIPVNPYNYLLEWYESDQAGAAIEERAAG